jgi:hypothetical protein
MASEISTVNHYVGLSTEDKPLSVSGGQTIPDGSTYHAIDTGDEWLFLGQQWVPDIRKARAIKRSLTL